MNCNYRFCQAEILEVMNGNRRYCNDECSYAERLEREKEKYAEKKSMLSEITRIEQLLENCFNHYGENPFNIDTLRKMKMNWEVFSKMVFLNGFYYRAVGSYGYMAMENNTIKIVKI